jgi:subtilisin family serine protease
MRSRAGIAMPALIALLASACAATPAARRATPLPEQVRSAPSQFVVVTVRNDALTRASRAGSTPRAYDEAGAYGTTSLASATVHSLERTYGLREISAWPIMTLRVQCVVFRVPPSAQRSQLLGQLVRDPRVESAQPLNEFATQADPPTADTPAKAAWMPYNDPYGPLQLALHELDVVQAQRQSRGAGVRIAVIDTGIDYEHPDLAGRVIARSNFVDDDDQQFKHDRHGTQVAGIIAAVANNGIGIVGVAPEARLFALKACWQSGHAPRALCNSFTLAQALEAAIVARADVVNLSLAGPPDPLLTRLVAQGMEQGVLFVGAAAPPDVQGGFPAEIPGVLGVGAAEDRTHDTNYLLAPGHEVLTLIPGGTYDFASGSSLATAEVSGIVARMRARRPHLTAATARQVLQRSSQTIQTQSGRFSSINACAALADLLASNACEVPHDSYAEGKRPTGSAGPARPAPPPTPAATRGN